MKRLLFIVIALIVAIGLYAQDGKDSEGRVRRVNTFSNRPLNQQERLSMNALVDEVNLKLIKPYSGTIDLTDSKYYYPSLNRSIYDYRSGTLTVSAVPDNQMYLSGYFDTLYVPAFARFLRPKYHELHVYGGPGSGAATMSMDDRNIYYHDFETSATARGFVFNTMAYPSAGDTIWVGNMTNLFVQSQLYSPTAPAMIHVEDDVTNIMSYSYMGARSRADNFKGLNLAHRSVSLPADSLNNYYAIYHEDYTGNNGLRGGQGTYFLYSQYGDVYFGNAAVIQTQLSASLTDGAPTDAQIDAATGTTPADAGAGWSVTIKDSDGTGLLYRVESDGTNWFYYALTTAL